MASRFPGVNDALEPAITKLFLLDLMSDLPKSLRAPPVMFKKPGCAVQGNDSTITLI